MTKETFQLGAKGNIIKGDRDLSVLKRKQLVISHLYALPMSISAIL
jgi:hypothetical protein